MDLVKQESPEMLQFSTEDIEIEEKFQYESMIKEEPLEPKNEETSISYSHMKRNDNLKNDFEDFIKTETFLPLEKEDNIEVDPLELLPVKTEDSCQVNYSFSSGMKRDQSVSSIAYYCSPPSKRKASSQISTKDNIIKNFTVYAHYVGAASLQKGDAPKLVVKSPPQEEEEQQAIIAYSDDQSSVIEEPSKSRLRRIACTCPNCKDVERPKKIMMHMCHIPGCNKLFAKTCTLRSHLRWHSGDKPFVCSWFQCCKRFVRSDELQRHTRTHTGDKRYHCTECDKRFMRSDHLSKHIKSKRHSKKKKLVTPTIPQSTFSDSSSSDNQEKVLTKPDKRYDHLPLLIPITDVQLEDL